MATEKTTPPVSRDGSAIVRAATSGLVAGVAFGALIQFGLERMGAIGALYTLGDPSLTVGWVAHLAHSALFGGLYGLAVDRPRFDGLATASGTGVLTGMGFGAALWAVNVVFVWPVWLGAVGLGAPPVPNLAAMPLVGHLVYGGMLGALYGRTREV